MPRPAQAMTAGPHEVTEGSYAMTACSHPVSPDFAPDWPESTWVVRPEQKDALALLDGAKPGQQPVRVLLYGIGGVGKTMLAYQLAEARKDRCRDSRST